MTIPRKALSFKVAGQPLLFSSRSPIKRSLVDGEPPKPSRLPICGALMTTQAVNLDSGALQDGICSGLRVTSSAAEQEMGPISSTPSVQRCKILIEQTLV